MSQAPAEQTASLLQGIVKQMSNGVNATEILRGIIKPQQNEDLIQTAIKMAQSAPMACSASEVAAKPQKSDKCPLLMELLYKSFQARLAKEQRLKALQHHETSLKPNHSAASAPISVASSVAPVNTNQALATSAVATGVASAAAEAAMNPFPFNEMLATMQQPPQMTYPAAAAALFSPYYSQMLWPQYAMQLQPQTALPMQYATTQNLTSHHHVTTQPTSGVKRAAGPVMYADKRMKLA